MNQFKKYTATVLSLACVLTLSACSSKEEAAAPVVSNSPTYQAPSIPAATPVAPTVTPEVATIPEVTEPTETPETPEIGSDLESADILTSATVDPDWTDAQKYEQYANRVLENISELANSWNPSAILKS